MLKQTTSQAPLSHSVYILPTNGLLIVCICILNWECSLTSQTIYISGISNKNVQNLKSHQLTELRPKISESSEKLVRKRVSGVSRGSRSITQESESTSLMSFLLGSWHKNTNYNQNISKQVQKSSLVQIEFNLKQDTKDKNSCSGQFWAIWVFVYLKYMFKCLFYGTLPSGQFVSSSEQIWRNLALLAHQ